MITLPSAGDPARCRQSAVLWELPTTQRTPSSCRQFLRRALRIAAGDQDLRRPDDRDAIRRRHCRASASAPGVTVQVFRTTRSAEAGIAERRTSREPQARLSNSGAVGLRGAAPETVTKTVFTRINLGAMTGEACMASTVPAHLLQFRASNRCDTKDPARSGNRRADRLRVRREESPVSTGQHAG